MSMATSGGPPGRDEYRSSRQGKLLNEVQDHGVPSSRASTAAVGWRGGMGSDAGHKDTTTPCGSSRGTNICCVGTVPNLPTRRLRFETNGLLKSPAEMRCISRASSRCLDNPSGGGDCRSQLEFDSCGATSTGAGCQRPKTDAQGVRARAAVRTARPDGRSGIGSVRDG